MRVKLQLVMCTDAGREATVTDIVTLQKDSPRLEHLGWMLAEATQRLTTSQQRVLAQQVNPFLALHAPWETCGMVRKVTGSHSRTFRRTPCH